MKEIPKDDII